MTDPDGDGHYDCIPAVDNFQIISKDDGMTWGPITNISSFLGEHRGLLPGPGTGTYVAEIDRILFAGHFSTAERPDGRVVVYYSDDGGNDKFHFKFFHIFCQGKLTKSLPPFFHGQMSPVLSKLMGQT